MLNYIGDALLPSNVVEILNYYEHFDQNFDQNRSKKQKVGENDSKSEKVTKADQRHCIKAFSPYHDMLPKPIYDSKEGFILAQLNLPFKSLNELKKTLKNAILHYNSLLSITTRYNTMLQQSYQYLLLHSYPKLSSQGNLQEQYEIEFLQKNKKFGQNLTQNNFNPQNPHQNQNSPPQPITASISRLRLVMSLSNIAPHNPGYLLSFTQQCDSQSEVIKTHIHRVLEHLTRPQLAQRCSDIIYTLTDVFDKPIIPFPDKLAQFWNEEESYQNFLQNLGENSANFRNKNSLKMREKPILPISRDHYEKLEEQYTHLASLIVRTVTMAGNKVNDLSSQQGENSPKNSTNSTSDFLKQCQDFSKSTHRFPWLEMNQEYNCCCRSAELYQCLDETSIGSGNEVGDSARKSINDIYAINGLNSMGNVSTNINNNNTNNTNNDLHGMYQDNVQKMNQNLHKNQNSTKHRVIFHNIVKYIILINHITNLAKHRLYLALVMIF
jgi:hypothetical protein